MTTKNAALLSHTSRSELTLPAGSCDCHVHLFDQKRFPYAVGRSYTPGTARAADLLEFEGKLGIERVVLVQPSVYDADNSAVLAGLRELGQVRARGVAVVDLNTIKRVELDALHEAGVRGIRLNLATRRERNLDAALNQLQLAADSVGPLGWSIQVYADLDVVTSLSRTIAALQIPIVLDHFMGVHAPDAPDQRGLLEAAIDLVRSGHVYVKLSAPYRASRQFPTYEDLDPFAARLIQARPDRMLWASDWPHTGSASDRSGNLDEIEPFRNVDAAKALDRLFAWASTDALRHKILVENPASLYGFDPIRG